jgi:hemolysin D
LMVIVPEGGQVTAEVVIENKDIGFVNTGQTAEVKVETFSFTRYGTVPATVTWVTADAVNDEKRGAIFPATLRMERAVLDVNGKPVKLTPGMQVTAEVKTGRRRVIDYLLSPVQESLHDSVKER